MTIVTETSAPAVPSLVRGMRLLRVSARRWRVLDRRGVVIGHIATDAAPEGVRFRAERFDLAAARLRGLGTFWRVEEAVDCLRYLR
ncbi:DNA mismatch repair protein [Microbacterium sp.]|uniref:DNA mismatch repair protein n=1 Tax=Microbacterium sp. TaxID=51671 RepID=UPI003C7672D2